ncbi:hypothetical protein HMPREF1531_00862 [Propionibacterium sp. oral taxon 192 str. F0372]|nr:hypothetical protein HMPREF1531_00862 [Propionibacterium sp. oral taxon 192 str. F0372]
MCQKRSFRFDGSNGYARGMPKLSDARQQRQAARIYAAAERCFARNGFHATSMDEIIAEAGMSSSTVYRYYPGGKQELIHAVSAARIDPLLNRIAALADQAHPPPLEQAFLEGIGVLWPHPESAEAEDPSAMLRSTRLALNAWNEIGRDAQLGDMLRANYITIRTQLTRLIRRWQDSGIVTTSLEPVEVAALMQNVVFGLVIEQVITGNADIPGAAHRLSQLLTPLST